MRVIGRGDAGPGVVEIRAILLALGLLDPALPGLDPASARDLFDASVVQAVRAFQQARGLTATGDVNEETWRALDAARWTLGARVLSHERPEALFGDDVRQLQERLLELGYDLGRADGIFGRRTAAALAYFQREVGLVADGVCGPLTIAALRRLGRKVVGGRPTLLRETARMHSSGPALVGKRIVIDPGHGGGDPGITVIDGGLPWTEAELAYDLAARLEGRLAAAGVRVNLTRGPAPASPLTEANRASLTNELGADLIISLHLDGHDNPLASGIATYHYGYADAAHAGAAVTSTLAERLAELLQREIVDRTGLHDCRTHAKTWDLLRLTRMPAVRVEVGYLTSPEDLPRLVDPLFRDRVADAVMTAVQRFYQPLEPETGADVGRATADVENHGAGEALVPA
jgi:N-acetylmuramoyl-L-alanine amidase